MSIYLIILLLFIIGYVIQDLLAENAIHKKELFYYQGTISYLIFILEAVSIILLIGLRGLTGTDTLSYQRYYDLGIYSADNEKLYFTLTNFFRNLGLTFQSFELIWAFLTMIPIYWCIYKMSRNYVFSMLVMYLLTIPFYAFNIARQMFAVSLLTVVIVLVSQLLSSEKNYLQSIKKYVLIFLLSWIAINIHNSSKIGLFLIFISLIVYFVFNKAPRTIFLFGFIAIVLSLVTYLFPSSTANLISYLVDLSGSDYTSYVSQGQTKSYNASILTLVLTLLRVLILFSPYVSKYYKHDYTSRFLISAFAFSTVLYSIQASWITDRIAIFFILIPVFLFPNLIYEPIIEKPKSVLSQLYFPTIIFLFLFLTFFRTLFQNFNGIIPYGG